MAAAPSGTPPPFPCHYQSSSRDAQDHFAQPVQVSPRWDQSCPAQHSTQNTWLAKPQQAPLSPRRDLGQHSQPPLPSFLWHIQTSLTGTFSSCTSVFRHNQNHSHNGVQGPSPTAQWVKNPSHAGDTRDEASTLGQEDPHRAGNSTPVPLPGESPWTGSGGLQPMGFEVGTLVPPPSSHDKHGPLSARPRTKPCRGLLLTVRYLSPCPRFSVGGPERSPGKWPLQAPPRKQLCQDYLLPSFRSLLKYSAFDLIRVSPTPEVVRRATGNSRHPKSFADCQVQGACVWLLPRRFHGFLNFLGFQVQLFPGLKGIPRTAFLAEAHPAPPHSEGETGS